MYQSRTTKHAVQGSAPHSRKIRTRLQAESLLEVELPNQGVHRRLAVLTLDLGQKQAYRVAIVPAPELQLVEQ